MKIPGQKAAKPHQKIQHPPKMVRKVAARKQRLRFHPVTSKPLKGPGMNVFTDIPEGAIMSSSHVTKKQATVAVNAKFSPKYFKTRGALARDLSAHQYARQQFPNAVFTMLYPGKAMPTDVSIFKVPIDYNRIQIKNYLEELYDVKVLKVNTAIMVGKRRLDQYARFVKEKDWKKAYVRTSEPFPFPWARPLSYAPTDKQRKKKLEAEQKKKEEAKANAV